MPANYSIQNIQNIIKCYEESYNINLVKKIHHIGSTNLLAILKDNNIQIRKYTPNKRDGTHITIIRQNAEQIIELAQNNLYKSSKISRIISDFEKD